MPDYVLTDGFPVTQMPCPSLGVKKGDMVAASIAAASIVAKVTRDRIMRGLHRRYPGFGFAENKGYGTPEHWAAIDVRPVAGAPLELRGGRAAGAAGPRQTRTAPA